MGSIFVLLVLWEYQFFPFLMGRITDSGSKGNLDRHYE